MTPELLIETEARIQKAWANGDINGLTHLCGSIDGMYEEWLCGFFHECVKPTDWIFGSHRAHYIALLSGAYTPDQLVERVLSGHSMSLYGPRFVTSAIVAGTCGLAAGVALAAQQSGNGERVYCFLGDGAADEGCFFEAVQFVEGRNLPCVFILENNNSSCGVTQEQRGIKPFKWDQFDCVIEYRYQLRHPHAGDGSRPTLKSQTPASAHTSAGFSASL